MSAGNTAPRVNCRARCEHCDLVFSCLPPAQSTAAHACFRIATAQYADGPDVLGLFSTRALLRSYEDDYAAPAEVRTFSCVDPSAVSVVLLCCCDLLFCAVLCLQSGRVGLLVSSSPQSQLSLGPRSARKQEALAGVVPSKGALMLLRAPAGVRLTLCVFRCLQPQQAQQRRHRLQPVASPCEI